MERHAATVLALWPQPRRPRQQTIRLRCTGRPLVSKYCARSHAVGRIGAKPHAGAPAFRTLAEQYPIEGFEEALGEGIVSGHPHMPEFRFGGGAIIAYLNSIQER